ncbi:MAG TPA: TetR/AcrR family transcriptional regulator [Amycolatopsis sp.]|nr:TetR/AcrR family transcriptional regulator [Amycolatopsis sp.]
MTPTPQPKWRRLEPDERREQIFECAARLFGERPYSKVSTSDIAADAGVARGLINHYFGTKRELYLTVVRRAVTVPAPNPITRSAGRLDEDSRTTVSWFLDQVAGQGKMWLVATGDGIVADAEVEQILIEAERTSADRVLDAIDVPADHPSRPELNALIRAYAGMVKAAGREWLLREELTREQVQTLLHKLFVALVKDVFPTVLDGVPRAVPFGHSIVQR